MRVRDLLSMLRLLGGMLRQGDDAARDEDTPPEERWWTPETRPARPEEADASCRHCERPLGASTVKVYPGCGVVFHAACYEDTEGGNAYATPGCQACKHRTYWR